MYSNFGPPKRPLTAREKSIRFRFGALFVFSTLCALTMGVLYNKQEIQFKLFVKESESKIDSLNRLHSLEIDNFKNTYSFKKIDSLQKVNLYLQNLSDSLCNENFPCQVELGRYQTSYEIFLKRNPKAAKQYGTIISEETE